MPANHRARLVRLGRIERMCDAEKLAFLRQSAVAEGTLAQLSTLAVRADRLAIDYARRDDADDGASLHRQRGFASGLYAVRCNAISEAVAAQIQADRFRREIAKTETRRSAIAQGAAQATYDLRRNELTLEAGLNGKPNLARTLNRSSGRRTVCERNFI